MPLCINVAAQTLHFLWCKAKNRWRSVDAHFHDIEAMLSHHIMLRQAAGSEITDSWCRTALACYVMQGQKSLTLLWPWFLGYRSNVVETRFVSKGGRYYHYRLISSRSPLDILWCNGKNLSHCIASPLTFIFRMWQRACSVPCSLLCRPIRSLWNDVTIPPIEYQMCKTVNRSHSVDAHLNHIETAFVRRIIVRHDSYTHYWHPIYSVHVLLFASRCFVTSQFLMSAIHAIWVTDDVALSHSRAFGW